MFDATASQYSRIQFEKINVDTQDPRCATYAVHGIPHVVFLDSSNAVVYSGGVWGSPEEFGTMVK